MREKNQSCEGRYATLELWLKLFVSFSAALRCKLAVHTLESLQDRLSETKSILWQRVLALKSSEQHAEPTGRLADATGTRVLYRHARSHSVSRSQKRVTFRNEVDFHQSFISNTATATTYDRGSTIVFSHLFINTNRLYKTTPLLKNLRICRRANMAARRSQSLLQLIALRQRSG